MLYLRHIYKFRYGRNDREKQILKETYFFIMHIIVVLM